MHYRKMEKVTLYDQENDKMYDVFLSVADAQRASSGNKLIIEYDPISHNLM